MAASVTNREILAGDIGGTKVNLGLFSVREGRPVPRRTETFPVARYSSLSEMVEYFLKQDGVQPEACCLGVAGPVVNKRCFTTNLPWVISEAEIKSRFGFSKVELINDLVATAEAIPFLEEGDVYVLNPGLEQPEASRGLIAAGTGLGEAFLFWNGNRYIALPSEGGHADFAPNNPLQADLWYYLHKHYGHVSLERILSGPGLLNVYRFLCETRKATENREVASRLRSGDASQVIAEFGLRKMCPICEMALDLFVNVYGAEAGNMALRGFTLGGIYIGGGIAPKILDKLQEPVFMKAFVGKGRLTSFLSKVPVLVILDETAGLKGAACHGLGL